MVDSTVPLSPIGPRKRAAPSPSDPSNKLRSPDRDRGAPRVGAVGDASLQSNPTRAKSWRKQPDPEFARNIPLEGDGDVARQSPSRRLYDPSIDNPNVRSDVARLFDPSNLAPAALAPRVYDKQAHVFRSKKEPQRRKDIRPREVFPPTQQKQPAPPQPLQPQAGGRPVLLSNPTQQGSKDSSSEPYPEKNPGLVLQPETRPISQEQLVAEVKGIYAGLVMVEAKCVDVDNKQAKDAQEAEAGKQPKLNNEQWQALIALHRTLLHEHHDFFLASQHPSASPALRRLASKYAMPARMWRHGIHSFLELLRHRLPDSLEHMLSFIYLAYSMMALLFETVPTFEDTWIECLGDLGRYRMAIEDDDIRDREVWTGVARFWYSKAADKSPTVGRLYHHLAILARPNALQQLYFYTRSLSCVQPFLSARESILTLFDPILCGTEPVYHRSLPVDTAFIKAHGILFTGVSLDRFGDVVDQFLSLLDNNIGRVTSKWKEQGIYIAVANFAALFGYASKDNLLRRVYTMEQSNIREVLPDAVSQHDVKANPTEPGPGDRTHSDPVGNENVLPPAPVESNSESSGSQTALSKTFGGQSLRASGEVGAEDSHETSKDVTAFANAKFLTFATLDLALQRIGDPNVLPHVHISLVFMNHIMRSEPAMKLVKKEFPWESLASMLNTLVTSYDNFRRVENHRFPEPEKGVGRPLPEDFNIRGLEWAASYYPEGWFENALVDDEERTLELASMAADRKERILWLAYQLAQVICYILFRKSNPLTVLVLP
jgi:Est1 DNA/RNA binding domain